MVNAAADELEANPVESNDQDNNADHDDEASNASSFHEFWLHDLIELGHIDALKAGLEEDEDVFQSCLTETDDMGCTPLHTALLYPNEEILSFLWSFGPQALALDTYCNGTPLLHLVLRMTTFSVHRDVCLTFLERLLATETFMESALQSKDDVGNSIFHIAAMANVTTLFAKLDPSRDMLEGRNRMGDRPLHVAVKFRSVDVIRTLVHDHHVDILAPTSFGLSALHLAAASIDAETLLPLLDADWKQCTMKNGLDQTPLDVYTASQGQSMDGKNGTCFLYHPDAMEHLPMAMHVRGKDEPPADNLERMRSLVTPGLGVLRTLEFEQLQVRWEHEIPRADIGDVLRVHEMSYFSKLQTLCGRIPDDMSADDLAMYCLDPDTALSKNSLDAAMRAAGNVCAAVDKVVRGDARNAFCIVRPPGHHAGPVGKVTCEHDRIGSHGFCLLNNVAIGAAYARSHYKAQGINRIAILDFDVHHGNGTEDCLRHLVPRVEEIRFETPYTSGTQVIHKYKPWRNDHDADDVYFCSVHGYGMKDPKGEHPPGMYAGAWFYPGSGETNIPLTKEQENDAEDGDKSPTSKIINIGLPYQRGQLARQEWRRVFRNIVLPQVMAFKPDLIFLSAGFDGHKNESVNWGYIGLMEHDYEWLTQSVVQVANSCCNGRVISVLEGGYNFHGRVASCFSRSVAAHARGLVHGARFRHEWSDAAMAYETQCEESMIQDAAQKKAKRQSMEESDGLEKRESKRQRKVVDYVALAAELQKENTEEK
ncbi:unnamed protein product [Aphanomyces euteiches]|uniref:Histone deacetylase domain-containing protein n=1 Tax=Aphanomyces euteiches TaxID=100861 RepID=A0A6G0WEN5_9STRA|nr:hypothetical protein Ae201684_015811 [Aphanomyces euteiches]KAH9099929.1 hypothetical protein Ae201684P_018935 [Aphanomyces euteiches]